MKTGAFYSIAAVSTTAVGALFLVGVYFPILNLDQYEIEFHQTSLPSIRHYIIGTPIAFLILALGWRLNRQSEKARKEGK